MKHTFFEKYNQKERILPTFLGPLQETNNFLGLRERKWVTPKCYNIASKIAHVYFFAFLQLISWNRKKINMNLA